MSAVLDRAPQLRRSPADCARDNLYITRSGI
jgi:hypothetical protein